MVFPFYFHDTPIKFPFYGHCIPMIFWRFHDFLIFSPPKNRAVFFLFSLFFIGNLHIFWDHRKVMEGVFFLTSGRMGWSQGEASRGRTFPLPPPPSSRTSPPQGVPRRRPLGLGNQGPRGDHGRWAAFFCGLWPKNVLDGTSCYGARPRSMKQMLFESGRILHPCHFWSVALGRKDL